MARSTRPPTADTAVVARYPSVEEARNAFVVLQNHGVDAGDIRLAGGRAEATERRVTRRRAVRDRVDRRLAGHVGGRVVVAAILGAAAGAAIGAAAVAIAVATVDGLSVRAPLFLLLTLIPAALGAVLAVFITFERSVGLDDTWQLLLDDAASGGVCVVVRVRDGDETENVLGAFADDDPEHVTVRRASSEGVHTVRPH